MLRAYTKKETKQIAVLLGSPCLGLVVWAFLDLQTRPKVVENSMNMSKVLHKFNLAEIFNKEKIDQDQRTICESLGLWLVSRVYA